MPTGYPKNGVNKGWFKKGQIPWDKGIKRPEAQKYLQPFYFKKGDRHTEEWKKMMSEKLKGRKMIPFTEEHKRRISLSKKGTIISLEARKKQSKSLKNYWLEHPELAKRQSEKMKGVKFTEAHRKNISKALIGIKRTPEQIEKNRQRNINNPSKVFKDTKIELKVEAELQKRNIKYQKQIPLCKVARVDFYLPEYRIVIQADGCHWHGCPIHNPTWIKRRERDKQQDKILIENNYKVYRFLEHEINQSVENCINQIKF